MTEKVLQEITEKRDRYTKHFMLPEKGTAAAVYPEPVHYETENGWEEIDNRLEAVSKDGKECYRNKASDLQVCFAKQTGENTLVSMEKDGKKVSWTMEENVVSGGFGEHIAALLKEHEAKVKVLPVAIENRFVEHGDVETLRRAFGIDEKTITDRICEEL